MRPELKRRMMAASDERGFTIVELLVAVVILIFVSVALMQTALVNIEYNVKNALRDEGVRLAREKLIEMRSVGLANVVDEFNGEQVTVEPRIRNLTNQAFIINTRAVDLGVENNQVRLEVDVYWNWKGETFSTSLASAR